MGSDSKIRIFATQKSDTWSNQMTGEKQSIAIAQEVWIDDDDELFSQDGEKCGP